ncbi:MAG: DEAD/DEAH box helicase, partial [Candidatus Korarchaeota archaeon]|nr:DEAD/DEAH box helicase [Candidatus Korarchaeota archaeon]NIU84971.1 DEAD/DEAH box helicase [Candidatus Thorarchaeota archaeon]NIW14994.1 DEAD/DEAH box helicase [Candidatus Thorarchaeota archaeon]NIW53004.1 DEAD/DEAH box helicase [Candidatus Korarchaeota archaeon]
MKIDEVIERYPVLEAPIKRIKTVDGIDELYPPQVTAVEKGIIEGKNSVLAIPTAAGKSVIGSTPVLIEENGKKKLRKIEEIIDPYFGKQTSETLVKLNKKNLKVFSLNPKNLKIEKKTIGALVRHKCPKELFKLKLSSGKEIVCTPDHNQLAIDSVGKLETINTEDLKEGQHVLIPRRIPYQGQETEIELEQLKNERKVFLFISPKLARQLGLENWYVDTPNQKRKGKPKLGERERGVLNIIREESPLGMDKIQEETNWNKNEIEYSILKLRQKGKVFGVNIKSESKLQYIPRNKALDRWPYSLFKKFTRVPLTAFLERVDNDLKDYKEDIKYIHRPTSMSPDSDPIKPVWKLNKKICRILGWFIAEGRNSSIPLFSSGDRKNLSAFKDLVSNTFGIKNFEYKTEKNYLEIRSYAFSSLLEYVFGIVRKQHSRIKEIPKQLFNAKLEDTAEFIASYYDGEGEVYHKEVTVSSASRKLLSQMAYLLLRFGIHSRLRERRIRIKSGLRPYFRLSFYGKKNMSTFMEFIGFNDKEKGVELVEHLQGERGDHSNVALIPNLADIFLRLSENLVESYRSISKKLGLNDDMIRFYAKGKRSPTIEMVKKISNHLLVIEDRKETDLGRLKKNLDELGEEELRKSLSNCGIHVPDVSKRIGYCKAYLNTRDYFRKKRGQINKILRREIIPERKERLTKAKGHLALLKRLAESDVFWDRVEEIVKIDPKEKGITFVYDLFVPRNHNFIAGHGGIFTHNTLISEFTMLYSILKDGGKAIYIVPLKALANQKYREFTEKYQPLGVNVGISTGDFDSSDPWLRKYDLIIATSEKTDSLMRHEAEWLRDLTVVVADEAHLVNSPKRGPTLEITLTRLMKLNSHVTFLLLSATLANAGDLADWIGGELIESDFRPVDLYEGVYYDGTITFKQKEDSHVRDGRRRPVLALAEDTLQKDKQAIVFVATRRSAEAVARRLSRITRRSLEQGEKKQLRTLSDDIYHVLDHPTEQCKKIATYVQNGAAFHHAGLCLPYSAKVQLADGRILEIGKLISENLKGLKVMSLNPKTLKIEPRKVKKLWKRKAPAKLLKITTRSGRRLRLTLGHPLPTIEEGKIKWKKAGNFTEGTYIAIPRKLPIKSNSDPEFINYLPKNVYVRDVKEFVNTIFRKLKEKKDCSTIKELAESHGLSHHLFYNYKKGGAVPLPLLRKLAKEAGEEEQLTSKVRKIWAIGSQDNEVKIPKKLNGDFLKLVGYIAADGTTSKNGSIRFFNNEESLLRDFSETVSRLFNIKVSRGERNEVPRLRFSSEILSKILESYFGIPIGKKSDKIRITDHITKAPLQEIACFLRACYSSDSGPSRDRNTIEYTTCSREFALGLCSLLLRFGIFPYLSKRKKVKPPVGVRKIKSKLPQYRVTLYNLPNILKFKERVGYIDSYHKNILKRNETVSYKSYGNDVIPYFGKKLKVIRDKLDLPYEDIDNYFPQATWWRWENEENPATRSNLKKLVEACKSIEENRCKKIPEVKELENLATSHIYWDRIEKIERVNYDKEWVYDLSVEGSKNFVANNMIVHNSGRQKLLIENNFRKGLIKFVAATPSLAMGVDLPAFRVILRDSKRYTGHGMDWIPTLEYKQMAGRCVTGDTTFFTRKGTPLKIEEIAKKYFEDKETGRKRIEDRLKVFSVDLENHKPCLSTVTHIWKRKVNKILKIKTKGGKIIKVTPDHLLISFRKTSSGKPSLAKCSNENWKLYNKTMKLRKKYKIGPNKIVRRLGTPEKYWTIQHWLYEGAKPNRRAFSWEKANNLEVGESLRDTDYIGSILGLKNKDDPSSPQSFLPMEYLVDKGENTFMMKQGHKKCRLPDKWSKKLCKFIAKIMADGNIYYDEDSNSYQIRYYNKSERVHERYAKLCKELFEKNVNTKFRRGSYQSTFKSFVVGAFLENIGVPAGKKALILRMPKVIFSLPENMIKSFLREYNRCDGWEDEHSYFFSTG